eukprot:CAMPEP_0184746050 /NCGR_PEP_ID=MMETSP0315-20130426/8624_1 /TAXON_ID=101924 /ORGANISM="Rhodosorus marinus, Strain UTEX LB 2760" /LENGTH=126 /DNA_ID=CAMNT_0027218433 /DNA_START=58 /DNA_END=438 /DNA_ORIENTATION=+
MASIASGAAVSAGTFVLAGASVSLTRPHEEVRVVTQMPSLQERIKVLFGKFKSVSNESSPETPAPMPTKQYVEAEEPKASPAPKGSRSNIGGDDGAAAPPTPFERFGFRPSKLPGPPKPYDPNTAI